MYFFTNTEMLRGEFPTNFITELMKLDYVVLI